MLSIIAVSLLLIAIPSSCYLFPKDSPSRLVKELNGVWKFRIDDSPGRKAGFDEEWYSKPLSQVKENL